MNITTVGKFENKFNDMTMCDFQSYQHMSDS